MTVDATITPSLSLRLCSLGPCVEVNVAHLKNPRLAKLKNQFATLLSRMDHMGASLGDSVRKSIDLRLEKRCRVSETVVNKCIHTAILEALEGPMAGMLQ